MRFLGAIVKVASRCNINCSYCYMYNLGDDTWKKQPSLMSVATIDAMVARVSEHCLANGNDAFTYCLHGGEPMLMPRERMAYLVNAARAAMFDGCEARFLMQTNGILLTPEWCEFLKEQGIRIGVSLDGPKSSNDKFRVDHKNRGTYDAVVKGLTNARAAGLDFGILSVVDISTDPKETFDHLLSLKPRSVDLLLPEATHDKPPQLNYAQETYARWLITFFRCWASSDQAPFRVRRFDTIIDATLGLIPPLNQTDAHNNEILVIETNGSIEPMDVLKVCEPGITKTNLNVHSNSLEDAAKHPLVEAYYRSFSDPCDTCLGCRALSHCGGGYFPHRYSQQSGFRNPSVYCDDLKAVIKEVQNWTVAQLPDEFTERTGLVAI